MIYKIAAYSDPHRMRSGKGSAVTDLGARFNLFDIHDAAVNGHCRRQFHRISGNFSGWIDAVNADAGTHQI